MQLTPEQQEQLQRAKAAGETRVTLSMTDEQKVEWQAAVEEELAGKEQNIAHIRKIEAAARQPGCFGDARRAIVSSRRPIDELSKTIGVEASLLSDFRAAEAELPSAALDRLIGALGLRLMQEIRGA